MPSFTVLLPQRSCGSESRLRASSPAEIQNPVQTAREGLITGALQTGGRTSGLLFDIGEGIFYPPATTGNLFRASTKDGT